MCGVTCPFARNIEMHDVLVLISQSHARYMASICIESIWTAVAQERPYGSKVTSMIEYVDVIDCSQISTD
jgi:deoxyribose-phosphate aldolase